MSKPADRRVAIYYTPQRSHPLAIAAQNWLGRDAFNTELNGPPSTDLVSEPFRYGFHGTLKAPFRLASDQSLASLDEALRKFAESSPPCPIGPLRIGLIDGFFALIPAKPNRSVSGLAGRIVQEFDHFRARMNEGELKRRMRQPLDDTELENLVSWGYPFVLDRYKFHLTLTNRVPVENRNDIQRRLDAVFEQHLDNDYKLDALSLFVQDSPTHLFRIHSQYLMRKTAMLGAAA